MMLKSVEKLRKKLEEDTAGDFVFTTYPEQHGFRADVTVEGYEAIADEIEREVAERCEMRTLDADGVPIRFWDKVTVPWSDKVYEVTGFSIQKTMDTDNETVWITTGGKALCCASSCHHYHAPTVEDVLAEMLDAWGKLPGYATNEAIIAEYAAKLRLAGDGDGLG